MVPKLQAVCEHGVLRPVEPLPLEEHQLVSVIILDGTAPDEEVHFEPSVRFQPVADHGVSLQAVRHALKKIPGSLGADFAAERNGR